MNDNEMKSSTESYPAFAHIGLRENPGKNLNQVTCPDRKSNPGHLVSQPDALTVTPQLNSRKLPPLSEIVIETRSVANTSNNSQVHSYNGLSIVNESGGSLPPSHKPAIGPYQFAIDDLTLALRLGKTSEETNQEIFLIEDLRTDYLLPSTSGYEQLLTEREEKRRQIPNEFYSTGAMIDRNWMGPNQPSYDMIMFNGAANRFHSSATKEQKEANEKSRLYRVTRRTRLNSVDGICGSEMNDRGFRTHDRSFNATVKLRLNDAHTFPAIIKFNPVCTQIVLTSSTFDVVFTFLTKRGLFRIGRYNVEETRRKKINYSLFNDARNCRGYISVAGHLNAIDLDRDRTLNLEHRRPALYRLRYPGRTRRKKKQKRVGIY
ncbi:hypothetical protein ANN_01605 [Periplaneta americana]|uniref:Uncharacterized protein n=1 Tax=Periplaneta americana TaxID=6978 RepID=A0ABQ8TWG4_PERAM|nr:hypothetical protein ANN_01605 [Periplaneta americana]